MKYEKPEADVVAFDFSEFMTGSGNTPMYCTGYADGHGHNCGTYTEGSSCASWTSTGFGGITCNNFTGSKCYGYSDSRNPYCAEYGYTCNKF